jgi:hypothetical protein
MSLTRELEDTLTVLADQYQSEGMEPEAVAERLGCEATAAFRSQDVIGDSSFIYLVYKAPNFILHLVDGR